MYLSFFHIFSAYIHVTLNIYPKPEEDVYCKFTKYMQTVV